MFDRCYLVGSRYFLSFCSYCNKDRLTLSMVLQRAKDVIFSACYFPVGFYPICLKCISSWPPKKK